MNPINILLWVSYFLAIMIGFYISDGPNGRDYIKFGIWLAYVAINHIVFRMLANKLNGQKNGQENNSVTRTDEPDTPEI